MFKRYFLQMIALGLLGLNSAHSYAEIKIAVVNVPKILAEAPQVEAATKNMEKDFLSRDQELVKTQKKLRAIEEQLSKEAEIMQEDKRRKLERELIAGKRELTRKREEFNEDVNIRRNEEIGKLQRKIKEVINHLTKTESYDLVLGEGVIYAKDALDITNKILQQLRANPNTDAITTPKK